MFSMVWRRFVRLAISETSVAIMHELRWLYNLINILYFISWPIKLTFPWICKRE